MRPSGAGANRPRLSVLRASLNTLVFLAALGFGCALVYRLQPDRPDVPVVSAKLAWLTAHPATYDTLFLGSSRMFDAAWPRVFDEKMTAAGHPTRSFNLAAAGMNFPETFYVLDCALVRLTKPPRFVVLESGNLYRGPRPPQTDESLRAIYWHDWHHTRLACESLLRSPDRAPAGARETLRLLGWNLSLFAKNYSNVGRGGEQLRLDGKRKAPTLEPVVNDGCNLVELTMPPDAAADFTARLARKKPARELPVSRDPVLAAKLTALTQRLTAQGTRVFLVLMPTFRSSLPEPAPGTLVDLDDPLRHPMLWRPENYFDPHHLNSKGAAIFSALLATEIAAQLE